MFGALNAVKASSAERGNTADDTGGVTGESAPTSGLVEIAAGGGSLDENEKDAIEKIQSAYARPEISRRGSVGMRAQLLTQVIERGEKGTVEEEVKTLKQEQELLQMQLKALVGKQEALEEERRQLEGDPAPLAEAWTEDPLPDFEDDYDLVEEDGKEGGGEATEEAAESKASREVEDVSLSS